MSQRHNGPAGGGENEPTRRTSKAAAELRWPGRALTSPTAGGGDERGEAQSKRGARWGCGGAHRGGWNDGARCEDGEVAAVWLADAEAGDGVLRRALTREDKGKEKGRRGGDGEPFKGDTAGSGGRLMGGTTWRRGLGGAWGQRGGRADRPRSSWVAHAWAVSHRRRNRLGRGLSGGPPLQSRAAAV
jgi:hypothetical protein